MAIEKEDFLASGSGLRVPAVAEDFAAAHELPAVFRAHGLCLNATLEEMLNEHFSHRTERRGCGFTQATRHLAVLVNRATPDRTATIEQLFAGGSARGTLVAPSTPVVLAQPPPHSREIEDLPLEQAVRALPELLAFEESKLLAALIADLVAVGAPEPGVQQLVACHDEIKVGTCPLAEKYFLEISDGFVRRKGRINVLVSDAGEPVLVEKLNLGDNHSCISVAPLTLNGVRIPAGCLFGVKYEGELVGRANRQLSGSVVPISHCLGFKLLRLTTLAVSPANRERAFTSHFRSQVDAGLFAPRDTTIAQLRLVAEAQL